MGITFDSKLLYLFKNFEIKIIKVQSLIEKWKRRNLTNGRVAIAKTILFSQFVYLLTVLDTNTSAICNQVQKILNKFILADTNIHWMCEEYIYTRKSLGGLGFINILNVLGRRDIFVDRKTTGQTF